MLKTLRFLPLLGGLLLASCGDDDGTEPTPSSDDGSTNEETGAVDESPST